MTTVEIAGVAPEEATLPITEPHLVEENAELQRQLDHLARNLALADPEAAARARRLSADIRAGKLDELAELDVQTMLDPSGIEERVAVYYRDQSLPRIASGVISVLEWIRNIGILVPITYTWYGLSQAATHYQQAIAANKELITQPFLLLWENGFDTLGGRHGPTFSELATTDFWVLMSLVVLTLVVHLWREMLREHHDTEAERKAIATRDRVENVLGLLSRALAGERHKHAPGVMALKVGEAVEHFEAQAKDLIALMGAERQRLENLAERREREIGDLKLFSEGLSGSTENLVRYTQDLRQIYERLQKSVVQLTQQVETTGARQDGLVSAVDTMAARSEALSETVSFLGHDIRTALSDLQKAAGQVMHGAQGLSGAVADLRAAADTVCGGEESLRLNLEQVHGANRSVGEALKQAAGRIEDAGDHLNELLDGLSGLGERLQRLGEGQRNLVDNLEIVASRQAVVTELSQKALAANSELSEEFRDAVHHLADALRTANANYAGFEERWMRNLSQLEKRLESAGTPTPARGGWRIAALVFGAVMVLELGSIIFLTFRVLIK